MIALGLKDETEFTQFSSVDFFIDGGIVGTDTEWPFSTFWIPQEEGNYTLSVVSTNADGIQELYVENIFVEELVGMPPDGTTRIIPDDLTQRGFTTNGSELMITAEYSDADDGINRVEFYLNGTLEHVDREAPYSYRFLPKTSAFIGNVAREWEVIAVGVDNSGNRISLPETGAVQSSSLSPKATIMSPFNRDEYSVGQEMQIRVRLRETIPGEARSFDGSQGALRQMQILANGQPIAIATETIAANLSNGSAIFEGTWTCSLDVAGSSGEIELTGVMLMPDVQVGNPPINFTPTIFTDPLSIRLIPQNLAGDPKAGIDQANKDLLGSDLSQEEIESAVTGEMDTGGYLFDNTAFLEHVASLSNQQAFQNAVDAMATFHMTIGRWPRFVELERILVNSFARGAVVPPIPPTPPATMLNQFIQETLSGTNPDTGMLFLAANGNTPPLFDGGTPQPGISYEQNRRDFVKMIHTNKAGRIAELSQQIQGSVRLQQFNLLGGLPSEVVFVELMVTEKLVEGTPLYLPYPFNRNKYETAVYISLLWQENMGGLTDKIVSQYSSLSRVRLISELMKNPRYFSRFGGFSISQDAVSYQDAPGWKWLDWLGHYNDSNFPWIYHAGLGLLYVHGPSDDVTWFYYPPAGWLSTMQEVRDSMGMDDGSSRWLHLYDQKQEKWVGYYLENPAGKTFYDYERNEVFSYETGERIPYDEWSR